MLLDRRAWSPSGASRVPDGAVAARRRSSFFAFLVFLPAHCASSPWRRTNRSALVLGTRCRSGPLAGARRRVRVPCVRDLRAIASPISCGGRRGQRSRGSRRRRSVRRVAGRDLAAEDSRRCEARAAFTPAELDLAICPRDRAPAVEGQPEAVSHVLRAGSLALDAVAGQLEERWQAEAECEADAHAVRGDGHRAVVLAAALVKVARLGGVPRQDSGSAIPPAWTGARFTCRRFSKCACVSWSPEHSAPCPAGTRRGRAAWRGRPDRRMVVGFSDPLHLVTEAMVTRLP